MLALLRMEELIQVLLVLARVPLTKVKQTPFLAQMVVGLLYLTVLMII